ncbi:uncharacterized protein LOC143841687 [Paroedura picta]|uniref:uncharacterized protein LOC143841687 n=1 Tax=Paroedura picta TaxID=143630 RepID=UPI00405649D7
MKAKRSPLPWATLDSQPGEEDTKAAATARGSKDTNSSRGDMEASECKMEPTFRSTIHIWSNNHRSAPRPIFETTRGDAKGNALQYQSDMYIYHVFLLGSVFRVLSV